MTICPCRGQTAAHNRSDRRAWGPNPLYMGAPFVVGVRVLNERMLVARRASASQDNPYIHSPPPNYLWSGVTGREETKRDKPDHALLGDGVGGGAEYALRVEHFTSERRPSVREVWGLYAPNTTLLLSSHSDFWSVWSLWKPVGSIDGKLILTY